MKKLVQDITNFINDFTLWEIKFAFKEINIKIKHNMKPPKFPYSEAIWEALLKTNGEITKDISDAMLLENPATNKIARYNKAFKIIKEQEKIIQDLGFKFHLYVSESKK